MKRSYIYIMSNKYRTVLYTGVTSDLQRRIGEHKSGEGAGFTSKYNCTDLLYYEEFYHITDAIAREKQIKNWKREWKETLIKTINPEMKNLAEDW